MTFLNLVLNIHKSILFQISIFEEFEKAVLLCFLEESHGF